MRVKRLGLPDLTFVLSLKEATRLKYNTLPNAPRIKHYDFELNPSYYTTLLTHQPTLKCDYPQNLYSRLVQEYARLVTPTKRFNNSLSLDPKKRTLDRIKSSTILIA